MIFIFGGKFLVQRIHNSEAYLNWVIGIFFTVSAFIQLYKIIKHKGAADKIHEIKKRTYRLSRWTMKWRILWER
jgi:phosphotransferase system  glucose/maltose/N-acetylglucosamine-specific IIC component